MPSQEQHPNVWPALYATELRRIERWLHDGTQNRLTAVNVMLGGARRALDRDPGAADAMLGRAQDATEAALAELRAVVRSFLPPVLAGRGLPGALSALAAACPVECHVDADLPGRCAAPVEATAYVVVAEALANVAEHSDARHATVVLRHDDDLLHVEVTDDGRGGARDLDGMRGRVEALGGTVTLASPAGGPTTLTARLPCGL